MDIEGKKYNFLYEDNTLFYIGRKSKYQIKTQSIKIIFMVENQGHLRHIFTYEQFGKNLEFFKIQFPWSEDVRKNKIVEGIKKNDKRYFITIENIDFKSLEKPIILYMNKFGDLSKYISYYLKGDINIETYEEKDFLDKILLSIDPQNEIEFFASIERMIFLNDILDEIKDGKKEYFFTGLYSIGKTFTLSAFNFRKESSIKKAYFNLEALKKRKKKLLAEKFIKKGNMYIIILDQIKFEGVGDNEYKDINSNLDINIIANSFEFGIIK